MKRGRIFSAVLLAWTAPAALFASLTYPLLAMMTSSIFWDELEFYRATRWAALELVPYLGFWENHFSLQWLIMAPAAAVFTNPKHQPT